MYLRKLIFHLGIVLFLSVSICSDIQAQDRDSSKLNATIGKRKFFRKVGDYFRNANKPKPHKRLDISFIGGPQYASSTQFGVAVMAAGIYKSDRDDKATPPSNVTLFGVVSTTGFYMVGIQGTHIFPRDRYRLLYTSYFYSMPSDYWGIGYSAGMSDYRWRYLRLQTQLKANFLFRITEDLYLGPLASFNYIKGRGFTKKNQADRRTLDDIIAGQHRRVSSTGIGVSVVYDSRDVITGAHKGVFLKIEQVFFPGFLGNRYAFATTDATLDLYQRVWKGGILAIDLHGQGNYGDVPWTMMSRLGGPYRMRGYYEGRFRDNNIVEAQIEIRQHLWRRNGMVVWVGAGNVFESIRKFDFAETLPNFGIGYRWEFKDRVNVRIDVGTGKDFKPSFMININEAF